MKKKILVLPVLLFISLLSSLLFTSCDKDTNCYVEVLVVNKSNRAPVSDAKVELYQHNCSPNDYNYATGVTDENGKFTTHFGAPAILTIKVTHATTTNGVVGTRTGYGTVRLIEGETKEATVALDSEIVY